ncbi:MAG: hypothetical protein ACI8Z5_001503 [Lentimonas sp.]|jgi:hypothetical protein
MEGIIHLSRGRWLVAPIALIPLQKDTFARCNGDPGAGALFFDEFDQNS